MLPGGSRDEHKRSDRLLSAAAGQPGARLIQVVHPGKRTIPAPWLRQDSKQRWPEPDSWILSPFPAASSTMFPASKATSRPRVSPKNRTAAV